MRIGRETLELAWQDGRREVVSFDNADVGEAGPIVAKHELHQTVIADFLDAIETGRAPMVSGQEALAAHRLIEAIEISSKSGQRVDVPQA